MVGTWGSPWEHTHVGLRSIHSDTGSRWSLEFVFLKTSRMMQMLTPGGEAPHCATLISAEVWNDRIAGHPYIWWIIQKHATESVIFFFGRWGVWGEQDLLKRKKKAKNACSCKGFVKRIQHQREAGLGGTLTDIFNYSLPMYSLNGKMEKVL